jgi:hypothetical protein
MNQLPLIHQKAPIVSLPCDILRTSKIYINGITMILYSECAREELRGIVGTELNDERAVVCI